jgi:hypothetical protein
MSVPSLLGKANECKNPSAEGAMRFLFGPSWEYLDDRWSIQASLLLILLIIALIKKRK